MFDCSASPCDAHVFGFVELAGWPVTVSGRLLWSYLTQRALRVISTGMLARCLRRCAATRHLVEQNLAWAFFATVGSPQISHVRMCLV